MKISREDVVRVAELAYLDLSESELETYRAQVDEILEYIGKLNELDTTNVEPMAQVLTDDQTADATLRDDTVVPCGREFIAAQTAIQLRCDKLILAVVWSVWHARANGPRASGHSRLRLQRLCARRLSEKEHSRFCGGISWRRRCLPGAGKRRLVRRTCLRG